MKDKLDIEELKNKIKQIYHQRSTEFGKTLGKIRDCLREYNLDPEVLDELDDLMIYDGRKEEN